MAKRFTDTEKWSDPWYRKLPVAYKKFFDYLCDRCDNAGVWKVDMELAQFQIGGELDPEEAIALFSGKVRILNPQYWHIPGFVPFQFGTLSLESKPHKSILNLMQKHQISIKGYPKGIHTLKEKDKDKEKGKDKDNVFGTEANFNALWDLYPNKDGRKDALRHFKATIDSEQSLRDIHTALKNYINHVKGKENQYIKNGSTWFNNWKDWVNYGANDSASRVDLKAESRAARAAKKAREDVTAGTLPDGVRDIAMVSESEGRGSAGGSNQ